jgi:hypothetical protein
MTQAWEARITSSRGRRVALGYLLGVRLATERRTREEMDDLLWARIVHLSVEKEVILRPPIFKDVDTLAKPSIEDTKAGKWELLNAGMRRYGMSKTLIVMFMYAQSAPRTL